MAQICEKHKLSPEAIFLKVSGKKLDLKTPTLRVPETVILKSSIRSP